MSETETLTLTDFLLARIAEDEAVATEAAVWVGSADWFAEYAECGTSWIEVYPSSKGPPFEDGALPSCIARFDPARVLAGCERDRRIIDIHYNGLPETYLNRCSPCDTADHPCPTLSALALPYAEHPDWREEWRA